MEPMNLGVIRLSDLKDDGLQTGPIRQREAITAKFAALGVRPEDITWAEDLDVSAFHVPPLKRPHLRRAFNTLTPGSTVVFYRLDRFVRRVFPDFSDMVSFAADKRLDIHSATESLDLSGPVGMMTATMIAFIAQMESENTSARVRNMQAYFRKTGRWKGALVPYGYRPELVEGKPGWWLTLDPETAPVLREAVGMVLAGHSVNAVARWLNMQGVLPPMDRAREIQGKPRLCLCGHPEHDEPCKQTHKCRHRRNAGPRQLKKLHEYDECSEPCPEYRPRIWIRESLYEIMRSPALCGYTTENKTQMYLGDDGMPVPFASPGVVDFETWQQLQSRLDERKFEKVRTQTESLLLNVAYCDCGAPFYYRATPNRDKTTWWHYYSTRSGVCPDKRRNVPVAALDTLVQRELLDVLGDLEVLRKVENTEHRSAIETERRAVAAQIVELTQEMFVKGRPRDNHHELMAALQERHAELTSDLDAEEMPETRLEPTGELFRNAWEAKETVERRLWLMDAGVRVVAMRGQMPPVDFRSRPRFKRSLITGREADVYAVIYLGNWGEMLRRAENA